MKTATQSLLTPKSAAEYLAVSTRTLDRLHHKGQLAKVHIGTRCVRYKMADLETLVAKKSTN